MHKTPSVFVNSLFLLASIACFAYYLANGIVVRFGQSILWVWPVIGLCFLARFALVGIMIKTGKPPILPHVVCNVMHVCVALALTVFIAGECVIMTGAFEKPVQNLDCIMILGAKVNGKEPSGALRNRITVASEYLAANPDTIAIASGGKGSDEEISEAQCILDGLIARGIDPSRVFLEDRSTTTVENMRYSFEILRGMGMENASCGIVTNNFHIFRALRMARMMGETHVISGIPVATTMLSLPHYMLREFAATVVALLRGEIVL